MPDAGGVGGEHALLIKVLPHGSVNKKYGFDLKCKS